MITIDMETYYSVDYSLSKLTTEEYVRDEKFQVIGVAVKVNDAETEWFSGTLEATAEWLAQFDWRNHFVLAHNAMFDAAILTWVFGQKPKAWLDTLSMARAILGTQVGGSLRKLSEHFALGVKGTEVEDAKGKRREDFSIADLAQYGEYCRNDVDLTYKLFRELNVGFPTVEKRLIDITIRMFSDPTLELDTEQLELHLAGVRERKEKLFVEANIDKEVLNSNPKFAALLTSYGVVPPMKISPATGKETYAFAKSDEQFMALLEHRNEAVQAIVAARVGAKSTLEETRTERFIAISRRGHIAGSLRRLPIPLKYYAAHTGRWGGSDKVNLQNLPSRGAEGGKLKRCIVAPRGHVIIDCDSAQIEARVLAWLTGHHRLLKLFRDKADVYKFMASNIFGCAPDEVNAEQRFIGKTTVLGCLAEGTLVLCGSGWKPIERVTTRDKLWDGKEWVCHQGLVRKGEKETLNLSGIWLTPDHKVLCGTQWLEAQSVVADANTLSLALDTGAANLPLRDTYKAYGAAYQRLSSNAIVGYLSTQWTTATSRILRVHAVVRALGKQVRVLANCIGGTQWCYPMTSIGSGYLIGYRPLLADAIPQVTAYTSTMAAGGYRYISNGKMTVHHSLPTYRHSTDGIFQSLKWIGQTLTKGMSRGTFALYPEVTTSKINEESLTLRRRLQTYDIALAGPRNRYTVLSKQGAMIVHNCGYGMGAVKFQTQLLGMGKSVDLDMCKSIIKSYRLMNPEISGWWNDLNMVLQKMLQNQAADVDKAGLMTLSPFTGILLPNGLYLNYPELTRHSNGEFTYKTRTGMNKVYGGKVAENCIAGGTEVLTDSGWIRIEEVTTKHRVHDGVEFVAHGGTIYKSVQACVTIDGVFMTPEHEVLTDDGWKAASQNPEPYRPSIRGVNRVESGAERRKETKLEVPMPVRDAVRESGGRCYQGSEARRNTELWVHDAQPNQQGQPNTWYEQASRVCRMAFNARPLPTTFPSSMGKLWRAWHNRMREVAGVVCTFLGRYGQYVYAGAGFGSGGQQRPLFSRELPLDFTAKQYDEQAQHRAAGGRSHTEQANGYTAHNPVLPLSTRVAHRTTDADTRPKKPVYDIVDAGPRSRFVVKGDRGPFVIHNCCQAVARCVIGEQIIAIEQKYRVALTVHDAIACVVPEEEASNARSFIELCMRTPPSWALDLPLNCESGMARNYGDC